MNESLSYDECPLEKKSDGEDCEKTPEEWHQIAMLRTEFKREVSQWVTQIRQGKMTENDLYASGRQWLEERQIDEDGIEIGFAMMERHLKFQNIPHGSLASAVELARYYVNRYEGANGYPPWVSPRKRVLYVLMLILGSYGRRFQFACNAVGDATGIRSGQVWVFIQNSIRHKVVIPIVQGVRFARAAEYLLYDKYQSAWKDIGLALGERSENSLGEVTKHCPWLFDMSDGNNKSSWDVYMKNTGRQS